MGLGHEQQTSLLQQFLQTIHIIKLSRMIEQLKGLLEKAKTKDSEASGRSVDCLRKIEYFKALSFNLGNNYLLALLPSIQPFILRQGFGLINQNDLYVLVSGTLHCEEDKYQGSRAVKPGKLLDLRESPNFRFVAESDCQVIRIVRSGVTQSLMQKRLLQMQREGAKKMKEYERLMDLPQNHIKLDILAKNSFFCKLGNYDRYELVLNSTLKEYSQYTLTHQKNKKMNKIGYIVGGKVKLSFNQGHSFRKERGITWTLSEGDWIGLQQYLWQNQVQSTGEVQSIVALILWIPHELFAEKFSIKTNYEAISNLTNLIRTKKLLFERSLQCRKRHQGDLQNESSFTQEANPELLAKVTALQGPKRKGHISRSGFQYGVKQKELPMPDHILHRTNLAANQQFSLPKLNDTTIVLFPEDYAKSYISVAQQKEMERLKLNNNKEKQLDLHTTLDLDPQGLYRTIFQKISYRFTKYQSHNSSPRQKSIDPRSPHHHNQSIYNNFRVPKQRINLSQKKTKTLSILQNGVENATN